MLVFLILFHVDMYFFKEFFMNQISQKSNRAIGRDPKTKLTRYLLDSCKKDVLINLGDPHTTNTLIIQFHTKKIIIQFHAWILWKKFLIIRFLFQKYLIFFLCKSFFFKERFPNILCTCQIFAYNRVHAQSLHVKQSRVTLKVLCDGRICSFQF